MAAEFSSCVEYGLSLSKRIYYGKEMVPASVVEPPVKSTLPDDFLPTAPMVYAMVREPEIVDNPDVPSYQPYVHGRCEPPALIPLHMHRMTMEIESHLDTVFVIVSGTWRVHCVTTSKKCDCRVAVPMGEKGSLLGVEVDVSRGLYRSQLITREDAHDMESAAKIHNGYFLKGMIYTFRVSQVDGGSFVSIKFTWSQKLSYLDGQFCIRVPFTFPSYVNPVGKKIAKREKISLNVNFATSKGVLFKNTSHPLKELKRQAGKLSVAYEADVSKWSIADFSFSYIFSSSGIFGDVLLQSPSLLDVDEREMFCLYLVPGKDQTWKVFRKGVVFIIDTSKSMAGSPLEEAKTAILSSLSKLNPQDTFNIIAFNGDVHLFSPSMELATEEATSKATEWITKNLIANGGTNILRPLQQAIKLLTRNSDSLPFIFLITDGAVEDEREICNVVKGCLTNGNTVCPRICTFGIGLYCNHYFLQMLAQIGRGSYDAAYDTDSVDLKLQRLFTCTTSVVLADICMNTLAPLESLELFPCKIPDLSSESPLVISGRYDGSFPDSIKVSGTLADMSNFVVELKVQRTKEMPLNRVLARRHIDMLTSDAWLSGSRELEEKVAKISKQTGVPSEYTCMILAQTDKVKKAPEVAPKQQVLNKLTVWKKEESNYEIIILGSLGIGFGSLKATAENIPPRTEESKSSDPAELLVKAASNCCSRLLDRVCCMCCIRVLSSVNDQCAIVLSQLCAALACFECVNCCYELCS